MVARLRRRLYTQADLPEDWDYDRHLGHPGQPPFTRGIHATGYRGKVHLSSTDAKGGTSDFTFSSNNNGVATNFGGIIGGNAVNATNSTSTFTANRASYDAAVISRAIPGFGARMGYAHWWADNLRTNIDFSMNHQDVPSFGIASIRTSNNKELNLAHLNLIWSPVAFVDLGLEYAWGHRVTVANNRGDAYTLLGMTWADSDLIQVQENVIAKTVNSLTFTPQ